MARAAIAGTVGASVDLLVLLLLVAEGLPAGLATLGAAAVGSIVNFVTAKWWEFRRPGGRIAVQGGFFAAQTSVWILLSALTVHVLVAFLRAPLVLARLGADALVFVLWGYPAQRWIFRKA